MTLPDLHPSATSLARIVAGVRDDQLEAPTPCDRYTVGDLLDHVSGFARAFAAAAAKDLGEATTTVPMPSASRLGDDWRDRIPAQLETLAAAWRVPDAWTGMTQAAGLDLPGEIAGRIALDEIVIHSWDLARATGQPFEPDPASLEPVLDFVGQFAEPDVPRDGLFGPVVEVPADAAPFDRILAITGRDPAWTPPMG